MGEHRRIDEPDRLRCLRGVDRDEIGDRNQLFDRRNERHAELTRPIRADERVVRDEPHAERVRALRDEHTNASETDDAERLAVQLDALPSRAVPLARLQVGVGLRNIACLREQQRKRVLCRRQDVGLRRVHDHHASARRLDDVDVVEPDARPPDDHELSRRFEHLGRDLGRAAYHEGPRALDRFEQLLARETRPDVDLETGGTHGDETAQAAHEGEPATRVEAG